MKKIYIFGNPLLDFDNLPILLKPDLEQYFPNIDFIETDPGDNFMPDNKGELTIIDTVEGINEVKILQDISKIKTENKYSVHDYDLGMHLLLLQKLGTLKKVKIFCVPMDIKKEEALKQLIIVITQEQTSETENSNPEGLISSIY